MAPLGLCGDPGACGGKPYSTDSFPSSEKDLVTTCLHKEDKDCGCDLSHNLLPKMRPHIRDLTRISSPHWPVPDPAGGSINSAEFPTVCKQLTLSQEIYICLSVEREERHFTVTLKDISGQRCFILDMNFHI